MPPKKQKARFVAYYRVSTKKQNQEMAAQKTAVRNYIKDEKLIEKSFVEQESGKSDYNRPKLQEALIYCQKNKATLLVAKLDRLSRDLEFIGWIQNSNIQFVCCDMPEATRETIGFMGVMARWEREQIAKRTKEALAEKKKKGVKLGSHRPEVKKGLKKWRREQQKRREAFIKEQTALVSVNVKRAAQGPIIKLTQAQYDDQRIVPAIVLMRGEQKTFKQIAEALNNKDIPSRWGGRWHKTSVLRVAKRNGLK